MTSLCLKYHCFSSKGSPACLLEFLDRLNLVTFNTADMLTRYPGIFDPNDAPKGYLGFLDMDGVPRGCIGVLHMADTSTG